MMRRRGLNPKSIRRGELAGHLGLLAGFILLIAGLVSFQLSTFSSLATLLVLVGTGSVFLVAGLGVCLFVRNLLQDVDVE